MSFVNDTNLKEKRIKGVLLGCAYGDAMGMPTENMSKETILLQYPNGILDFYPSLESSLIGRNFIAGQVTDDTINTIILLNSLVKNDGKANANAYIKELRNWMIEHPEQNEVIIGRSTRRAIEALEKGEEISQTGIWGTTNGASMKISPIGMISDYKDLNKLIENVFEICYPTHNTQIALQGACIIAALVNYAIQEGSMDEIWNIAFKVINGSNGIGYQLGGPKLKARLKAIQHDLFTKSDSEVLSLLTEFYGTGLETIETIPAVLALLHIGEGDPCRIGQIAASLGGDTDTIGAIACAIAGAIHPEFPENIIKTLENVNHLNFDDLAKQILPYVTF